MQIDESSIGNFKTIVWNHDDFLKSNAFVAFVDILGFSQIGLGRSKVERRDDPNFAVLRDLHDCKERAFSKVHDIYHQYYFGSVSQGVQGTQEEVLPGAKPEDSTDVKLFPEKYLELYVFSDSIVVICPIGDATEECDSIKWAKVETFFEFCSVLNQMMFDDGLPLRGAIAYGEVYRPRRNVVDTSIGVSILGPALIEAHKFECVIDAATIALCTSAEKYLRKMGRLPNAFPGLSNTKVYLPLKTERYYCIKTSLPDNEFSESVKRSFSKWRKPIDEVGIKIENTSYVIMSSNRSAKQEEST